MRASILLIMVWVILGCEENATPLENNNDVVSEALIFTNSRMYDSPEIPNVQIEYCTHLEDSNHTLKERVWVRHQASYSIGGSTTIVLNNIEYDWEIIDQYETDPSNELYWEYGTDYGRHSDISISRPITITYGTHLMFRIPDSFVGHVSVDSHSLPETPADSLERARLHEILQFYSRSTMPFRVKASGFFLLTNSDTVHFNYTHLDTFAISVDTTECN